jgi:hypothetical protein
MLATLMLPLALAGDPQDKPASKPTHPGFERMKLLAGDWVLEAQPASAGQARPAGGDKPAVTCRYRVTSGGTAIEEVLFPATPHEMVTMYYVDQGVLTLVHYCAVGNQPRMQAQAGESPDKLVFKFAGGSNLDPARDGHMHDLTLTLFDQDHLRAEWAYWKDGRQAEVETFNFKRRVE